MVTTRDFNWCGKCGLVTPTVLRNASLQGVIIDSYSACPFTHGVGLAVVRYDKIITCVVGLLNVSRPSAILRTVIAIIVNAVKQKAGSIRWLHIHDKSDRGVSPLLTHGNAAPTPSSVMGISFVVTSADHSAPDSIQRGSRQMMIASFGRNKIFGQTAATLISSGLQSVVSHDNSLSAVTFTNPSSKTLPRRFSTMIGFGQDKKCSESASDKILDARTTSVPYDGFRHGQFLNNCSCSWPAGDTRLALSLYSPHSSSVKEKT